MSKILKHLAFFLLLSNYSFAEVMGKTLSKVSEKISDKVLSVIPGEGVTEFDIELSDQDNNDPRFNLLLLRNLNKFCELGHPVLVGLSRKAMLGVITNKEDASDRLGSSIASAIFAVSQGADIVRVHDVNKTRDALLAWQFFSEETLRGQVSDST